MFFILIFIKQILWQLLWHGQISFLFSAWWMEQYFPTHPLSLVALENCSWVEEAGIAKNISYFDFVLK